LIDYAIFVLICVPGIVASPRTFDPYDGLAEQLSMFCAALALFIMTSPSKAKLLGRIARIGLGLSTVSFTAAQIVYLKQTADLVPTWIPFGQVFWADATTVAFALAAIAILFNYRASLAMRLMALMVALFGIIVWVPILIAHHDVHANWSEFAITSLIAGAAWVVSELKTF
jgi:hypothetical protein